MPGHTQGEMSALVNASTGPLFFTFDASHLSTNAELGINPGFVVDKAAAHLSLERIRAFRRAYPHVTTYFGHEPNQWSDKPQRLTLTRAK